jgi:hypothetical protein
MQFASWSTPWPKDREEKRREEKRESVCGSVWEKRNTSHIEAMWVLIGECCEQQDEEEGEEGESEKEESEKEESEERRRRRRRRRKTETTCSYQPE